MNKPKEYIVKYEVKGECTVFASSAEKAQEIVTENLNVSVDSDKVNYDSFEYYNINFILVKEEI